MLCGYFGTDEFHGHCIFHLYAFGGFRLFIYENWRGFGEISERNWDGGVLAGGVAELFHEFYALLDIILWTCLSVLGMNEDSINLGFGFGVVLGLDD